MKIIFVAFATLNIFWGATFVLGLDENAVKEQRCISPEVDPSINFEWIASGEKWYAPLMGKLELYRTASDLLGKEVKDITEAEMENNNCLILKKGFTMSGFGVYGFKYFVEVGKDGVMSFKPDRKGGLGGKYYIALTDNKNFTLGVTCFEDNEASWIVMSTKPTLSEDIKKSILEKLKSLGFNMEMVVEGKYEKCDLTESERKKEL